MMMVTMVTAMVTAIMTAMIDDDGDDGDNDSDDATEDNDCGDATCTLSRLLKAWWRITTWSSSQPSARSDCAHSSTHLPAAPL
jgi:hypothetical protein